MGVALLCPLSALAQSDVASDGFRTPDQALQEMVVADGLQVKTFAADPDILSISNIDVDHLGRVWACECVNYRVNNGKRPEGDRILILEDQDGDGVSDSTKVFYQGRDIDIAMGLCVLGNKAIVACSPNILLLEDTDGDDEADKKTILFTSDAVFQHDHSLHSFVFGPDGRFYGNFGNTGRSLKDAYGNLLRDRRGRDIVDNGRPYHGGMVFRVDRDFGQVEVLGHNFRNNYEATVDSFGDVWQSDNDDDGNLAVRLNYIISGGNYGYLDELTGERWRKHRIGEHSFRGKRHWHQNDPGVVPNVIETGNGAPTGVAVYEGSLLPEQMRNQVIFCDAGPHVVWSMPAERLGAGIRTRPIDILRSPDNNFRPIDAAVAPDGSIFISDWYDPVVGGFKQDDIARGRIYWVAPKSHAYRSAKPDLSSTSGLIDALKSPNYCLRYLAWMRLHAKGVDAESALLAMAQDSNPRIRARAYWLLGQIKGKQEEYIGRAIRDRHPGVRVVGARLADQLRQNTLDVLDSLAADASARVRAECAALLRYHDSDRAAEIWAKLARRHDGNDRWYLEALGIGADGKWDACLTALGSEWRMSETARRDIVWRSRASSTNQELAEIISSAGQGDDVRRFVRAFDFQTSDGKDAALASVVFARNVSPEVALAAADRIQRLDGIDLQEWGRRLRELLTRLDSERALRLAAKYELTDLYPSMVDVMAEMDEDLAAVAAETLLGLGQAELIQSALSADDVPKAVAVARRLALSKQPSATTMLLDLLLRDEVDINVQKEAARIWARSEQGGQQILRLINANRLRDDLKRAVTATLLVHRSENLRQRAEELFPTLAAKNAKPLPKLADLVDQGGDAQLGEKVFFSQHAQCANCHQMNGKGKAVGPDLSQIGTKLARSALFEAILYPSAAISHNYESSTALLTSGQAITGIVVNQNENELELRDAEGILRRIPTEQIEVLNRQNISLMPANLHQAMSVEELINLVEYLKNQTVP